MPRYLDGYQVNREGVRLTECENCGRRVNENRIDPVVTNPWERVGPGEPMPAGECRGCGALAHLIPKPGGAALTPEARATITTLADCLAEVHQENYEREASFEGVGARLNPEKWHRRESPDCSYCRAIEETRALLRAAKEN